VTGSAPAARGRRRRGRGSSAGYIDRAHPLRVCALLGAVATAFAIALGVATPFDHGIWLIAYLLLVGFAAPWLLAAGETRLLDDPAGNGADLQAGAWLAGMIAVPAGVLLEVRLLVVVGAAALLVALVSLTRRAFATGAHPLPGAAPGARRIHAALIAFMALSTAVGVLLAWDTPWL